MSLTNGYATGGDERSSNLSPNPPRSESDLSDVHELPAHSDTANPSIEEDATSDEDHAMQDMATSEMDDEEDAPGEEDVDYTADAQAVSGTHHDRSLSEDSIRPAKRKAPADDEDTYINQNPELYGLRRSGRAQNKPTRRVVESSDDEDDEVNSGSRPSVRSRSSRLSKSTQSESDDDDVYGGQRGRAFAKKQRQRLQATSGSGTPQHSELRFSTRRAGGGRTNYNLDDDEHSFEEEVETPQEYYVEDTRPGIDQVLNYRAKEGVVVDPEDPNKHDLEFFIKWQGQAHYHSTWAPWSELKDYKGFRRLENYFRKIVREDLRITHDSDVPVEDREKWNLDREAYLDSLNDYMKVERVISAQDGEVEDTEYFVKWKGLFYDSCTWEPASLVSELAQHEIDRYLDRTSKILQSNKTEANPATRSDYKPFRTQPSYIKGGQLREFQIHGLNFLAHHWCKDNNVILADEMGLGKTVQTVSFMDWLRHERGQQGPFIVVVPLSTMPAWADTFNNWTPDVNYVVYNGNEAARKIIRDNELLIDGNPKKTKFNVLLTTYEYILLDSGFLSQLNWQFMAVDEAHRLKNRESQLYAKLLDFGAKSRLLITGTPMQNTLSELSALMDFLMPGKIHIEEDIDLSSEYASKKLAELTDAISPYMIRRTKQKVENDLPPKTEKIIRVELSDVQLEYYKNILTRNYAALNAGPKAQKTSLLNVMMELKKASNHPFMFPNAEERVLAGSDSREDQLKGLISSSGKMMLLDQLLTKMKKDGHRVLIFSQMVKMLDILGDYLQLRGHQFQRLDGTIAAGPRRMAIDHFNAPDSQDFCFLLSTRAGGLGINLMTADTVILFDSDWNPQADLQAMARAHRIGQKNPVTIYRFVSKDTVEEEVLERARNKLMLEFITIQRGVTDKDALSDRISKASATTTEPTSSDDISRILKKRGQKMFEQTGNQRKLEELDIDAVLENAEEHKTEQPEGMTTDGGEEFLRSFEYYDVKADLAWDDIIPKDQLEKIKEEERKKAEAAYLESVIEQNQPRKRKAPNEDADESREGRKAKRLARAAATAAAADADSEPESDDDKDPSRELNEKECRRLLGAFERYGAIEEKEEDIIKQAKLTGRNIDVVKRTLKAALDESKRLIKVEEDRMAQIARDTQKPVTKKDKKAILFDFHGVKRCNAETLIERPIDMRMIRDAVAKVTDFKNFRVPEASKAASYTCDWGAKEDGMLCVGMARYGFGAWTDIRDDVELGLQDKFFLEEHRVAAKDERGKAEEKQTLRSPGAVHLVRRANYLISVLKEKTANSNNVTMKRTLDNRNRKPMGRLSTPGQGSSSPAPSGSRKHQTDIRASLDRRGQASPNGHRKSGLKDDRHRHPLDNRKTHQRHNSTQSATNGISKSLPPPKPLTEAERKAKRLFEPIIDQLRKVHGATKKKVDDNEIRLKMIKQGILNIGSHISKVMRDDHPKSLEDDMWEYAAEHHWPQAKAAEKRVSGPKLKLMFNKLDTKDAKPEASTSKPQNQPKAEVKTENGVQTEEAVVKKEAETKAEPTTTSTKPDSPINKDEVESRVDKGVVMSQTSDHKTEDEPEDGEVRE